MEKTAQREENNFIIGWETGPLGLRNGCAVMSPDKTKRLSVDYSQPVTLDRCKQIFARARELSGRDLGLIELRHSIYSKTPGNECGDHPETCYLDKTYRYDPRDNSLTIFNRDTVVYMNENGKITRGDDANVAYTDSLDI